MAKKKATTDVSIASQYTQDDVPALLAQVNEQLKALVGDTEKPKVVAVDLPEFGKISEIKTVELLVKAHSSVVGRANAYKTSAAAIVPAGIKVPPFKLAGHGETALLDAISSRVGEVANKAAIEKLKRTKALLEENLSTKDKLAKDLATIAKDLGNGEL